MALNLFHLILPWWSGLGPKLQQFLQDVQKGHPARPQ
jgi:hypothetical protein